MNISGKNQQISLEDQGIVTGVVRVMDIDGRFALVEPESKSGCKSCAMAKGCGTKMISGYFARNMKAIKLPNEFGGRVGDRIEVGMEYATILKLSAITYIFPLLGMMFTTIIGDQLQFVNLTILLLALFGLWMGFVAAQIAFSSSYVANSVQLIFLGKLASDPAVISSVPDPRGCSE